MFNLYFIEVKELLSIFPIYSIDYLKSVVYFYS